MLQNNIKLFFKQLSNHKLYAFVTVLGFSVSLMFIILISAYIKQETSVDKFHVNKDRLYRLVNENASTFGATTGSKLADALPEIESLCRVYYFGQFLRPEGAESDKSTNTRILLADSTFFNMFSFPLSEGRPDEVLNSKNAVILSQKSAHTLFGNTSPIGQQLKTLNGTALQVTGLLDEIPENTQFKGFDAIVNINMLPDLMGWEGVLKSDDMCDFTYYVLAKQNTNITAKEDMILTLLKKDLWLYKGDRVNTFGFEPITESYFSSKSGNIKQNSKTLITVLSVIVIIILILAMINYINMTIAHSGFRNKEIAIRKLMGSSRKTLILTHVNESVLFTFIAAIIGIILASIAQPLFNKLLETHISLLHNTGLTEISVLLITVFLIGLISGILPALHLTKLKSVEVVKGSYRTKAKTSYSKVLVTFQYTATITLIVCAIVITKQTLFMQNFDMGFNKENIFRIEKGFNKEQRQTFYDMLQKIPGVESVSFVCSTLIDGGNNQSFMYNEKPVSFQEFQVDTAFFSMAGIKYTKTGVAWSDNVIWLNHTAVKELGLDSLPKSFKIYDEVHPVYGVTEDFHFRDLHQPVSLAMLSPLGDENWSWNVMVKISGQDISGTMDEVKSAYNTMTDGEPFNYEFFDSKVDNWYKKESNTAKIITWFSVLTILISIMGILALVTFYNQLRIKEIGIRKVNGARTTEVMAMLNKDFLKWFVFAFVIAVPVSTIVMNHWLANFACKTEISWWIYAASGILVLGISLLTVSRQCWYAANRNPVESLRYE